MSSNTPLTYTTAATNFEFEVWQLKVCFSLFACQDIGDLVWPLHFKKYNCYILDSNLIKA